MENKELNPIQERQAKQKETVLSELRKTPIVQISCQKVGIGRATFYRWLKEDREFAKQAQEAINEGSGLVSDVAESQLISAIKDKNMTAIIFWLKNRHPEYKTKVEIKADVTHSLGELTPEQEKLIEEAIKLVALPQVERSSQDKNESNNQ